MTQAQALLASALVVSVAAVAAALYTQHAMGMDPCAWCVLQRLIFVLIAAWAVVGLLWRSALGRRVGGAGMLVLAGCGVAAATHQHFVAAQSASCGLSLADRIISGLQLDAMLPSVFMPLASCADAKVDLAGMPYEFWSFALFVLLGLAALRVLVRPAA